MRTVLSQFFIFILLTMLSGCKAGLSAKVGVEKKADPDQEIESYQSEEIIDDLVIGEEQKEKSAVEIPLDPLFEVINFSSDLGDFKTIRNQFLTLTLKDPLTRTILLSIGLSTDGKDNCNPVGSTEVYSGTLLQGSKNLAFKAVVPPGTYYVCIVGRAEEAETMTPLKTTLVVVSDIAPTAEVTNTIAAKNSLTSIQLDFAPSMAADKVRFKVGTQSSLDCEETADYLETSVTDFPSIDLSGWADDDYVICLLAGSTYGIWQPPSDATVVSWQKDTVAPASALHFRISRASAKLTLNWSLTANSEEQNYLIVARRGEPASWIPVSGTDYTDSVLIDEHKIRIIKNLATFEDTNLIDRQVYFYKLYTFDSALNYSSPESDSMAPAPADTWTPTSSANAPSARALSDLLAYKGKLLVWGAASDGDIHLYDASSDQWETIGVVGGASPERAYQTSQIIQEKMFIFGGVNSGGIAVNTGGVYDFLGNSWSDLPTIGLPSVRLNTKAIWTGGKIVIPFGMCNLGFCKAPGIYAYDLAANTFSLLPALNGPPVRMRNAQAWTGSEIIIWGGWTSGNSNDGYRFNNATETWTPMTQVNAPSARSEPYSAWTGTHFLVWSGTTNSNGLNSGGLYNPETDSWTAMATTDGPGGAYYGPTVWADEKLIVWSGTKNRVSPTAGGAVFDPPTNSWTQMSQVDEPEPRWQQNAIWDNLGKRMIVWGGLGASGSNINTGGVYYP